MDLIDNINRLLGDDLKQALKPGVRLKVARAQYGGVPRSRKPESPRPDSASSTADFFLVIRIGTIYLSGR
jgi:hypothetical protein